MPIFFLIKAGMSSSSSSLVLGGSSTLSGSIFLAFLEKIVKSAQTIVPEKTRTLPNKSCPILWLLANSGWRIVIPVPVSASSTPDVSFLVTFSLRYKAPPKTIKQGEIALMILASIAEVRDSPVKSRKRFRGVPRKPRIIYLYNWFALIFLRRTSRGMIRISETMRKRKNKNVVGVINESEYLMIGGAKPQTIAVVRRAR